ncbi:MAG TPA: ABC transporter permease subunit [Nevskiaceae bacterium]|nr:ABC transporter permease subunit [Nevskiaceae bacterium]
MNVSRVRPFKHAAETTQAALDAAAATPGRSLWQDAWRRLKTNRAAMASLVVLVLMILAAAFIPLISPYHYYTPQWDLLNHWPTLTGFHIFGTDDLGRDELVRVMWGMRVSLMIGLVASVVSLVIGVLWGATAGYLGGWVDSLMMRIVDILYAVPFIPFVIVLLVLFGRNLILIFIAIGAVSWLDIARIVRGQALSLKKREFVEAARASGVGSFTIIRRHLVPNLIGIVVIYITLTIPALILFEAFLSFLGLGVQAPMASLGSLVSDGVADLQSYPYLLIVPSVFLAGLIYCFNYLGDGLRDALDPKDRR